MIREIGIALGQYLAEHGCPLRVVDGPEPSQTTTYTHERIVLEHDTNATESFGPAHSQGPNPARRATRTVACKLTVYAQSPRANATAWEHRNRVEDVVDLVVCGLYRLAAGRSGLSMRGRFVAPEDTGKAPTPAGAAYELTFTIERAVYAVKWDGSARPEATVGPGGVGIASTTQVSTANGPSGETPATGCGG